MTYITLDISQLNRHIQKVVIIVKLLLYIIGSPTAIWRILDIIHIQHIHIYTPYTDISYNILHSIGKMNSIFQINR